MLTNEQILEIRSNINSLTQKALATLYGVSRSLISDIQCNRAYKEAGRELKVVAPASNGSILIIGDLHHPFCLDGYLSFCKEQQIRFDCQTIVFIGDIIDNHYASFHDTDPDGLSGGDELDLAISKVSPWVKVFPQAYVTIGNHDRIIMRKSFSGSIPKKWIREYSDVLESPNWNFVDEVVIDKVQYIHGEGGTARVKARNDKFSTVQGHLHTHAYVESLVGRDSCIYGMQVGCGVDRRAYAMAYAQTGPKPAIGCGVVLDNGRLPLQIMADLTEERFSP